VAFSKRENRDHRKWLMHQLRDEDEVNALRFGSRGQFAESA
jgi:hypothetical protein